MKKLMIAAAIVCAAAFAQAASVAWKVSGSEAADAGVTVYILTSAADSYGSVKEFTDSAFDSASIKSSTVRGKTSYATARMDSTSASLTKTTPYYLAVVSSDQSLVYFYDVTAGTKVYDSSAQESAPSTPLTVALSSITGSSHTATIPEPTSGLLLLLGMAGLALKRKRA